MLDFSVVRTELKNSGFCESHQTKKLVRFDRGTETLYVKRSSLSHPVVAHGKHAANLAQLLAIVGVKRTKASNEAYHNSNMRAFDTRLNYGRKPTRYGFDFEFDDVSALRVFLTAF